MLNSPLQISLVLFIVFFLYRDGARIQAQLENGAARLGGELWGELLELAGNTVKAVMIGIVGTAAAQALAGDLLPALAIPSTLQDSLAARLDRLAPAKEIAQIGAAIGRDFSHRLIAAVSARTVNTRSSTTCSVLPVETPLRIHTAKAMKTAPAAVNQAPRGSHARR